MVSAAGFEPAYGSSILSRSATPWLGVFYRLAGVHLLPGWPSHLHVAQSAEATGLSPVQ